MVLLVLPVLGVQAEERMGTPALVNPAVRSPHRASISLDGKWEFSTDPNNQGESEEWFQPGKALPSPESILVPGCWEAQGFGGPGDSHPFTPEKSIRPLRGSYMGTAWYRKAVPIPPDWEKKQVWLKVGGIHAQGWIWINGKYAAHVFNYCGSYKYNITDLIHPGQEALIAIKVRNDITSRKGLFGWIQRFGGLYRSVEIECTPNIFIDDVFVNGNLDEEQAEVHVSLRSCDKDDSSPSITMAVDLVTSNGTHVGLATKNCTLIHDDTGEWIITVPITGLIPWSPENPFLYTAKLTLTHNGKVLDGWEERFGVRKLEVRGGDFYLNNQRYFIRGFGDDYIYPITLCSPASRDEHRKHLRKAREYGFNYVRHHTHCEIPEFFEAADEVGIMVQPELPYYGPTPSAQQSEFFLPEEDLKELNTHYRRYVSFSTYCTGNEGHLGTPLDEQIYNLGKRLDPTRLFQHQDGGKNTPTNSDFFTGPVTPWKPGTVDGSRPFFAHEYMNLATDEDPRLSVKYTGAVLPPRTPESLEEELKTANLPTEVGYNCLDAGNRLQRIHQKSGLESARLDPACDGYIYWTLIDVGSPAAQGLFNQFWNTKPNGWTSEEFCCFNQPAAILAKMKSECLSTANCNLMEGEECEIEWWLSYFSPQAVHHAAITWNLITSNAVLATGDIPNVSASSGDVKPIGKCTITIPPIPKPVHARLIASFQDSRTWNSWDLWLFPKVDPNPDLGKRLCASPSVFHLIGDLYPGMDEISPEKTSDREVYLTDCYDETACALLQKGRRVLLLNLQGVTPGTALGWWTRSPQTGTIVAHSPVLGDYPHDGFLDRQFFRLLGTASPLTDLSLREVEPVVIGHGSEGYLVSLFQAHAAKGRLLASGLHLLPDAPESKYLLDQMIRCVTSSAWDPKGRLDPEEFLKAWKSKQTE